MTARVMTTDEPPTFHNGTIGRLNAWFFDTFDRYINIVSRRHKQRAFSDIDIDTVICSLVLCTVADAAAGVGEIRRVLRPGGTFRFVEHVAARPISPRRWIREMLVRPWSWLFEGCQLCRDTAALIQSSGFADVDLQRSRLRSSVFVPVNSVISGRAVVA